jgi:hypothetical protein
VGECFGVPVRVGVGVADDVGFALVRAAEGVALSEALGVLVLVLAADADGLAGDVVLVGVGVFAGFVFAGFVGDFVGVFVGECDGVAAGLDVSVLVGAGVGSDGVVSELVAPDGDGLADGLADWVALTLPVVVGDGLVAVAVGVVGLAVGVVGLAVGVVGLGVGVVEVGVVGVVGVAVGVVGLVVGVVGVAVGVVGVVVGVVGLAAGVVGVAVAVGVGEVAVGVGEVGVGDGDGLGGELGSWSGSHDLPLDVVAALAVAVFAATVRLTPEVAVSRTLPAIRVTVAGRACAKRMKRRPYPVLLVAAMERLVHYGLAS